MAIHVEFFGVPRHIAGTGRATILREKQSASLRQILEALANQYPRLDEQCIRNGALREGFVANLDGEEFITDTETIISSERPLLIFSADAGG